MAAHPTHTVFARLSSLTISQWINPLTTPASMRTIQPHWETLTLAQHLTTDCRPVHQLLTLPAKCYIRPVIRAGSGLTTNNCLWSRPGNVISTLPCRIYMVSMVVQFTKCMPPILRLDLCPRWGRARIKFITLATTWHRNSYSSSTSTT